MDTDNLRHCQCEWRTGHSAGYIKATGSDCQHSKTAPCRCMGVGTQKCLSRKAEPLQVNLVADSVTRTGEIEAILFGKALEEQVVVRILVVGLDSVMVNIGYRKLSLHPLDTDSLELQVYHGSSCILSQGLVDLYGNLFSSLHLAGDKVLLNNLISKVFLHFSHLFYCE